MTVNTRRREELAEAIRQSGHVFLPGHEVTRLLGAQATAAMALRSMFSVGR